MDRLTAQGLGSLKQLASAGAGVVEAALSKGESLGPKVTGDVMQAVRDIALFKIDGISVERTPSKTAAPADDSTFRPSESLSKGLNASINLTISRLSGKERAGAVYAPRYHKEKTASWSVLIENKGQVLAYRKVASLDNQQQMKILVSLNTTTAADLRVYVVCDAILGTDCSEKLSASF